jgi:hypothetical protein
MTEPCVGSDIGCNYVFSKLGCYITKAQIVYFNSEPSISLVNGLKQSGTDHMLAFFEDPKKLSYHKLWDVPLNSGGTTLVSTLWTSGSKAKLITEMIRT